MNKKKPKIFAVAAVLSLMTAAVIFGVPPGIVSAQAGSVFTMTAAFNGLSVPNAVVIVNQTTGAINVCNSQAFASANSATANETCEFRGRAIPGSGTSSLSVTAIYGSAFILNNQSGLLLECTTTGKVNCVSHGIVIR